MIELYAITDDPAPECPPLRTLSSGSLSAVYGVAEGEPDLTPEALWRHEQLIETLMQDRALLPVRYGTRIADPLTLADALGERQEQLRARLERVRGATELGVRAQARTDAAAARVESGRDYLRGLARRDETAALLHEPLAVLARESVLRPGTDLLRAAYLVDRPAVPAFVELVQRLQDLHPDLAILCTGPWPPYSFAEGQAA